jgi:hypothetical protein
MTEFDRFIEGRMERLNVTHNPDGSVDVEAKEELLEVCDFCGIGNVPTQTHPASDVPTLVVNGEVMSVSVGDWCGCDPCSDLIHRFDRDGLKARALAFYSPLITAGGFAEELVVDMITQAQDAFWSARRAPGQTA